MAATKAIAGVVNLIVDVDYGLDGIGVGVPSSLSLLALICTALFAAPFFALLCLC